LKMTSGQCVSKLTINRLLAISCAPCESPSSDAARPRVTSFTLTVRSQLMSSTIKRGGIRENSTISGVMSFGKRANSPAPPAHRSRRHIHPSDCIETHQRERERRDQNPVRVLRHSEPAQSGVSIEFCHRSEGATAMVGGCCERWGKRGLGGG